LDEISSYYRAHASLRVAVEIEARIHAVIGRISKAPKSAQRIIQRPSIRVVPLLRYPYKIFYTFDDERVLILHIRHTSRGPWEGER
jgi:plasmid stabilization system protein ParE